MTAKMLAAVRLFQQRSVDGDFTFVTSCLNGTRGEDAKRAAEVAVNTAAEYGHIEDDPRIADHIVALVEDEEADRAA